jgi:hypothetical protein
VDYAEKIASELGKQYGCLKVVSITGVIKHNGKYKLVYQLIGCSIRVGIKGYMKDPFLIITIDPFSKETGQCYLAPSE